jgi:hypothetical protein
MDNVVVILDALLSVIKLDFEPAADKMFNFELLAWKGFQRNSGTQILDFFGYPNLRPRPCDFVNELKCGKNKKACKHYDLQAIDTI